MVTKPHHFQREPHEASISTKRKRDNDTTTVALPTTRIQTTGLETLPTRRKLSNSGLEDGFSPRTAVSARFQRLGLHSSSPPRRPTRRSSMTMPDDEELAIQATSDEQKSSQHSADDAVVMPETPEPSAGSVVIDESAHENEHQEQSAKHDFEHAMFEFKAGGPAAMTGPQEDDNNITPIKRARFGFDGAASSERPSERRGQTRDSHPPPPPPPSLNTPKPRSISPSGRKLSTRSPPSSSSSTSTLESELSKLWWQPSEIVGHSPADPDEDNRGVNGIGYKKTNVEAWTIAEKRKRQLAEWRSREAKEARAARAGGRRGLLGRLSKTPSRGVSPVEQRNPVEASPQQERSSRVVRFEVR